MSGSCKHQKRCGLLWLRLLYIFLKKNLKKNCNSLVKNKCGDQTDKNKYRSIALFTIISKVLEHIISYFILLNIIHNGIQIIIKLL